MSSAYGGTKRGAPHDDEGEHGREGLGPRRSTRLRTVSSSPAQTPSSFSEWSLSASPSMASVSTARTSPSPSAVHTSVFPAPPLPRKIRIPAIKHKVVPFYPGAPPSEAQNNAVGILQPPIPTFNSSREREPVSPVEYRKPDTSTLHVAAAPSTPSQPTPQTAYSIKDELEQAGPTPEHMLRPTTTGTWRIPAGEIPANCFRADPQYQSNRRQWVQRQHRWILAKGYSSQLQVISAKFMYVIFMCLDVSLFVSILTRHDLFPCHDKGQMGSSWTGRPHDRCFQRRFSLLLLPAKIILPLHHPEVACRASLLVRMRHPARRLLSPRTIPLRRGSTSLRRQAQSLTNLVLRNALHRKVCQCAARVACKNRPVSQAVTSVSWTTDRWQYPLWSHASLHKLPTLVSLAGLSGLRILRRPL